MDFQYRFNSKLLLLLSIPPFRLQISYFHCQTFKPDDIHFSSSSQGQWSRLASHLYLPCLTLFKRERKEKKTHFCPSKIQCTVHIDMCMLRVVTLSHSFQSNASFVGANKEQQGCHLSNWRGFGRGGAVVAILTSCPSRSLLDVSNESCSEVVDPCWT